MLGQWVIGEALKYLEGFSTLRASVVIIWHYLLLHALGIKEVWASPTANLGAKGIVSGLMIRSVLLIPLAYALGTFPTAALIASSKGTDIGQSGSGNPGASNAARVLGWKSGLAVLLIDVVKGVVPTLAGLLIDGRPTAWILGVAAVLGHIWPVQRKFRGGKGVATAGGMLWVVEPIAAGAGLLGWALITKLTKKASVASLFVILAVPVMVWLRGRPSWEVLAAVGLGVLLIIRHRSNLVRLFRGSEPTIR